MEKLVLCDGIKQMEFGLNWGKLSRERRQRSCLDTR